MFIESTGMVCSVGLSAESACAAMRAGIANFQELPYLDNRGEPIIGAMVPGLAPNLRRRERLGTLLAMAVADCLRDKVIEPLAQIPLLVGLAEPDRPGGGAGLGKEIIVQLIENVGGRFHPQFSRTIASGHTSGFEGLGVARELFKNSEVSTCLVCGVDSYINASSLLWLDRHQRLKTNGNSDGVIPGEAAAAVLVRREESIGEGAQIRLEGLGFAKEKATPLNEEPMIGLGLAQATRSALDEAGLQYHQIDLRISDVTGESYGFREQALVEGRLLRVRKEEMPIWHSADSCGDIGAAAGLSELVMAFHAIKKNYVPGVPIVCFTSALPGDRAVAIVR